MPVPPWSVLSITTSYLTSSLLHTISLHTMLSSGGTHHVTILRMRLMKGCGWTSAHRMDGWMDGSISYHTMYKKKDERERCSASPLSFSFFAAQPLCLRRSLCLRQASLPAALLLCLRLSSSLRGPIYRRCGDVVDVVDIGVS